MEFDKRLLSILRNKDRAILDAENEILEGLTAVEGDIFKAVKKQLNKMNKEGGKFVFDETNTTLVNQIDQIIVDEIQRSDYPGSVRKFLQDFDTVTDYNAELHESLNNISPDELKKLVDPFKQQTVEDTLRGLTGSGVNVEFVEPVRQELFKNIVSGANATDVEAVLRQMIEGDADRLGGLERYVGQVTRDALNQYDGQINAKIADEFNLDAFQYVGSLIDDSRPQCRRWVNKEVILKEDLQREINWANSNGSGMIPGTIPDNFAVFRGGYNCRHTAIPFKMTKSEKERLQEDQEEEEDRTTERNVEEVKQTIKENKKIKEANVKKQEKEEGDLQPETKTPIKRDQILSTRDFETDKNGLEVLSFSDGANDVANEFGTFVSFRNSTEWSEAGTRKFLKATGRTDLSPNDILSAESSAEGFVAKDNRSFSIKVLRDDVIQFEKAEGFKKNPFEISEDDVKKYIEENSDFVFIGRGAGVFKKAKKDARSGTGVIGYSRGKFKFWSVKDMRNAKKFGKGQDIGPTITHEAGHLIQNKYDPAPPYSSKRPLQDRLLKERGITNRDALTAYGETNSSEWFAETWAAYVHANEDFKRYAPKMFEVFEELLFDVYKIDRNSIKIAK